MKPKIILVGLDRIGLEAIAHLRRVLSDVGIIALTLAEGDAYKQTVVAAGADGIVHKAELTTNVLPVIRQVILKTREQDNGPLAGTVRINFNII